MKIKNNYNECLTNLACSIRKYFGLDYKHNTLPYIDELLEKKQPKNVVTILCDGMGSNIMDRVLEKDSFLIKNRFKSITTVFPATTVAATTSMQTGLNPVETGMLGWNIYYKDIDKTITTYLNIEKGDIEEKFLPEAAEYKSKHMICKTTMDEINEHGKYKGYTLYPFGDNAYIDIDDLYNKISTLCSKDGKKYIYAYDVEPDNSMHLLGTDDNHVYDLIKNTNKKIEQLASRVKDTIIFVVADHGHYNIENIDLNNYPEIINCLKRTISLEARAVNFFIKDDMKETFKQCFNKEFKNDFDLYEMKDVIKSKLFGDGKENEIFRDELGDFLAIAKSNKALIHNEKHQLKSTHAGYTDDEILVPLIIIDKK